MDVVMAGDLLLECIGDAQIVSLLDSPILANTVLNVDHLSTTRVTAQVLNNRETGTNFRILTICLLLACFVSAAGCHSFELCQGDRVNRQQ